MNKIKAHINNIALSHTIFDLPFAFMGAFLASGGRVDGWTLFLIALAVTSGRAAALAIDNLADLKFDKLQPRMAHRAMVRGEISKREAKIFIAGCFVVLILTVALLPPICIKLLPFAALPFIIYPFTFVFGICDCGCASGWMDCGRRRTFQFGNDFSLRGGNVVDGGL